MHACWLCCAWLSLCCGMNLYFRMWFSCLLINLEVIRIEISHCEVSPWTASVPCLRVAGCVAVGLSGVARPVGGWVRYRALDQGITIAIREGIIKLLVEGESLIIVCTMGKMLHGSTISKISSGWRMEGGLERL
jgi:hypothetical protein